MSRGGKGRGQGRKPMDGEAAWEVTPVRMSIRLVRKARRLGNGNASEGIRQALEQAEEPQKGLQLDNTSVE